MIWSIGIARYQENVWCCWNVKLDHLKSFLISCFIFRMQLAERSALWILHWHKDLNGFLSPLMISGEGLMIKCFITCCPFAIWNLFGITLYCAMQCARKLFLFFIHIPRNCHFLTPCLYRFRLKVPWSAQKFGPQSLV